MKKILAVVAVVATLTGGVAKAGAGQSGSDKYNFPGHYLGTICDGLVLPLPRSSFNLQRLNLQYISPSGQWHMEQIRGDNDTPLMKREFFGSRIKFRPSFMPNPLHLTLRADTFTQTEINMPQVPESIYHAYGIHLRYSTASNTISFSVEQNRNAWSDASTLLNMETMQLKGSVDFGSVYLDASMYRGSEEIRRPNSTDMQKKSTAFLVDVGATVAKRLDLGVTYLRASSDRPPDDDGHWYPGLGGLEKNRSFYILTGNVVGSTDNYHDNREPVLSYENLKALGFHVDYKVNDLLDLFGAIGYARSDDGTTGLAGDSGWEYNLGAAVKIYNTLKYEAHFGYFASEDTTDRVAEETTFQASDIYMLSNKLSMTF